RAVEAIRATWKAPIEQRKVEPEAARNVGRAIRSAQPTRQIDMVDVDGACAAPSADGRIQLKRTANRAPIRRQRHVGIERSQRSRQPRVELGDDADVPQSRDDLGPFLKQERRCLDAEVERCGLAPAVDGAIDEKATGGGVDEKAAKRPPRWTVADPAGQAL